MHNLEVSTSRLLNAAYASQTCQNPACGILHKDNRHADRFHLRNPHWHSHLEGDADHVAVINIKLRIDDHQINRLTPYREVKKVLDEKFLRRTRSSDATAHGKTPSKPR